MPQNKNLKKTALKRDLAIDFLRGLAVILMIFIHASAYFSGNPTSAIISNYLQFVVPAFVFCSSYLYFTKHNDRSLNFKKLLDRFLRLYLPYIFLYAAPMVLIFFLFDNQMTISSITNLILLGDGRDVGWLVILFMYILLLCPVIVYLSQKNDIFLKIFIFIATFSTILLTFIKSTLAFRYTMWLPWSAFLIFTFYFARLKKTNHLYFLILSLSLCAFLIGGFTLENLDKSMVFTDNKYPPNIYYLSYGVFFTTALYILFKQIEKGVILNNIAKWLFSFLSSYSYPIFFIHFIILEIFIRLSWHKPLGPYGFFIVLIIFSVLIIKSYLKLKSFSFFFNIIK